MGSIEKVYGRLLMPLPFEMSKRQKRLDNLFQLANFPVCANHHLLMPQPGFRSLQLHSLFVSSSFFSPFLVSLCSSRYFLPLFFFTTQFFVKTLLV
ncbi:hypothetical protein PInf_001379 [Phytophthora infestans]|nr:hypothetical protein PInf_001379 [Phytophthora infestans]